MNNNGLIYDVYFQEDADRLVQAGNLYLKNDTLSFKDDSVVHLEDGDEYRLNSLLELIKNVNQNGNFQMSSRPPDNYISETYIDKNGVKRLSSKGGSWSRTVQVKDKDFIEWFKVYLLGFGITLIKK